MVCIFNGFRTLQRKKQTGTAAKPVTGSRLPLWIIRSVPESRILWHKRPSKASTFFPNFGAAGVGQSCRFASTFLRARLFKT
jgi:hypothetical protein